MTDGKPQDPPGFTVRTEAQQAAFDNGWRRNETWDGAWGSWTSDTAPGTLFIAGAGPYDGPWYLAFDHEGVIAEIGLPSSDVPGPGSARFAVLSRRALGEAAARAYRLATSLPSEPLRAFVGATKGLPSTTVAERLVVQRVGQDIFRDALLAYWEGRCPLTGITDPALLRASHITPWAECANDAERLDVHNGLLLSALWDAAFDRGLVSFADDGRALRSPALSAEARAALWAGDVEIAGLTPGHRVQLARHRARHGF